MGEEKTLLQQIREKEQEYATKLEEVKRETDQQVASAEEEMESLLCTADGAGQKDAERIYWEGRAATEKESADLTTNAQKEQEAAAVRGEKNLPQAVEKIVALVTMQ